MLVFINSRAGWKLAQDYFASSLQLHLDRSGAIYEVVPFPPADTAAALSSRDPTLFHSVAIVGGDGTVATIAQHLCQAGRQWACKPILVVPAGEHNGIAASLGITSPDVSLSSLSYGRLRKVPLWEVTLSPQKQPDVNASTPPPPPFASRLMLGSMQLGIQADIVQTATDIQVYCKDFTALPVPHRRQWLSSMYWLWYKFRPFRATVALWGATSSSSVGTPLSPAAADTVVELPKAFVISVGQAKFIHRGYSLTPEASFDDRALSVTLAAGVSRLRGFHLLHREAASMHIEPVDGVSVHANVSRLQVVLPPGDSMGRMILVDGEVLGAEPLGSSHLDDGEGIAKAEGRDGVALPSGNNRPHRGDESALSSSELADDAPTGKSAAVPPKRPVKLAGPRYASSNSVSDHLLQYRSQFEEATAPRRSGEPVAPRTHGEAGDSRLDAVGLAGSAAQSARRPCGSLVLEIAAVGTGAESLTFFAP